MGKIIEIRKLTPKQIASICDHTFLKRAEQFDKTKGNCALQREKAFHEFMQETIDYSSRKVGLQPYAICVRPEDCKHARTYLAPFNKRRKNKIHLASVVGFPDGAWYSTAFKQDEAEVALWHGAEEIDMVLDYKKLKQGKFKDVKTDIEAVRDMVHDNDGLLKVILETSELDGDDIMNACMICEDADVDFVKTSTGFSAQGATANSLYLMRRYFSGGIKMSGGVNEKNVHMLLSYATDCKDSKYINLDPMKIRIGESSLLDKL